MPEFVTEEVVERAKAHVIKRKGVEFVNEVMLERIDEGGCVPTMRRKWSGSILLPLREVVLSTILPHPKLIYYVVNILLISMF